MSPFCVRSGVLPVQVLVKISVHADVNYCDNYITEKDKITRMPLTNPVIKMHFNFKIFKTEILPKPSPLYLNSY